MQKDNGGVNNMVVSGNILVDVAIILEYRKASKISELLLKWVVEEMFILWGDW